MGRLGKNNSAERLCKADNAVRNYAKGKKRLSEREDKKMHKLLEKRAEAMSDYFGVKIHPICSSYKESKKMRKKFK